MGFKLPNAAMPLPEYVAMNGQEKVAKELNVTQGAICKALRANREIYISASSAGVRAIEVKPFPAKQ